jgi:hypothetical protein
MTAARPVIYRDQVVTWVGNFKTDVLSGKRVRSTGIAAKSAHGMAIK